jgi:hypothetical protein
MAKRERDPLLSKGWYDATFDTRDTRVGNRGNYWVWTFEVTYDACQVVVTWLTDANWKERGKAFTLLQVLANRELMLDEEFEVQWFEGRTCRLLIEPKTLDSGYEVNRVLAVKEDPSQAEWPLPVKPLDREPGEDDADVVPIDAVEEDDVPF